jgi:ketosteroid isomerase-like protein
MPQTAIEERNLDAARRYLAALEQFITGPALANLFTLDVVQTEFPNRMSPEGQRRELPGILAGAEAGKALMSHQRFEVRSAVARGDHVALEVLWVGTLSVAIGSVPAGGELRANVGLFLEFRDGRIASQRNYDCYEPW